MPKDTLLEGVAVVNWRCGSLVITRVEDDCSRSAACKRRKHGVFAKEKGWDSVLFEQELSQLQSLLLVVHGVLCKNQWRVFGLENEIFLDRVIQKVVQNVKVHYKCAKKEKHVKNRR